MSKFSDRLTLIIKVTKDCNLACSYCYMDKQEPNNPSIMNLDVLESIISKAQKISSSVTYVWHGGEPLLASKEYYRYITLLQQLHKRDDNQEIYNSIQTNGILLNESFAESLLNDNFNIGISYDANSYSQSPSRPFLSGNPSEPIARKRIQWIKSKQKKAGVLCVVTSENVEDAAGILSRLSDAGVTGVGFLPFKRSPNALEMSITSEQWASFLIEVFELWLKNSCTIKSIDPIESMVAGLMGAHTSVCTFSDSCFKNFLCIYPEGDIYPSSSLCDESFNLGNIQTQNFEDIFENSNLSIIRNQWELKVKSHCGECKYLFFCNGGCPEYAYFEYNNLQVCQDECRARKQVFKHIAQRMNELVPKKLIDHVSHPSLLECNTCI